MQPRQDLQPGDPGGLDGSHAEKKSRRKSGSLSAARLRGLGTGASLRSPSPAGDPTGLRKSDLREAALQTTRRRKPTQLGLPRRKPGLGLPCRKPEIGPPRPPARRVRFRSLREPSDRVRLQDPPPRGWLFLSPPFPHTRRRRRPADHAPSSADARRQRASPPAAAMVQIHEEGAIGRADNAVASHVPSTPGPSSRTAKTYLQALLTGLVLANSAASKGSAVYDSTQTTPSTCINQHAHYYLEAVEEEPEMEAPVAADPDVPLPVPAAAPGHIVLPVPVVAAHADEAEHVDHDEDTVNENGVPWLAIAGTGHKVRKWYNARNGGTLMTKEGLGHFVYGTYGPNGLEF